MEKPVLSAEAARAQHHPMPVPPSLENAVDQRLST
jgi:hypothetical protein